MPGQWSVSIELKREENLGKPLFEMCWFYMGIAQIALDPCVKGANVEKKVPQTILASLYTHPSPLTGNAHMYGNNTFQKGADTLTYIL